MIETFSYPITFSKISFGSFKSSIILEGSDNLLTISLITRRQGGAEPRRRRHRLRDAGRQGRQVLQA